MAIPGNLLSQTAETIDPNTSRWRPRLNCALSLGSGGRVGGDGCLTLTASAAGEMQAETVSSYVVTPLQTYFVFADAASGDQPERIGIEWLDYTTAPVGEITWAETTRTADSSWHRISVAGVCPVGATRARVVVSAVAGAAGATEYLENVYLGLPKRRPGNFLSFNAESGGELDLSAYQAVSNCTLTRAVPPFGWSETWYYGGGHMVIATATAAGDIELECLERPQVTPGTDYVGQIYISPSDLVIDPWVELRFFDADGVQLLASRAYLDQSNVGVSRQICSAIAPEGSVTAGLAAGADGLAAGQEVFFEGVYVALAVPSPAGNVIPYQDFSFEQGPGSWAISSGPATIARSSPWGSTAIDGSYALTLTSATVDTSILVSARYPVTAGENWRGQLYIGPDVGAWAVDGAIRWYDAAGVEISLSGFSGLIDLPNGQWWTLHFEDVSPAGAVEARCEWKFQAQQTNSVMQLDCAVLQPVLPQGEVTAHPETASITLTLREQVVGRLVTIWRVTPDGTRTLVRGPDGLIDKATVDSDLWVIEDYEAPLGVDVDYYVEYTDAAGSPLGFRNAVGTVLDPGDPLLTWLKDPGNPQRNIQLLVQKAPDWQRAIEQSAYRVRGRRNSVVHSDVRGGLEGDLTVWTRTDDERDGLHWILGSGRTLFWQAAPGSGVSDMYVTVGQVTEARVTGDAKQPWRAWPLPLTEADMPVSVGVNGSAGRTWQDLLAEFDTWQQVIDSYATWEDVLLNRRREG